MNIHIEGVTNQLIKKSIIISGSKSESNRLLVLKELFPEISIKNLSDSDDTHHMQQALRSKESHLNIGHAGTTMRFLTAFFSSQPNKKVTLSGSERMHNRPIEILVNALRKLGADIAYLEKEGYPPLEITGKKISKCKVQIKGNVSSQYISALLLIGAKIEGGLKLELIGEITSVPYIKMTLSLLNQIGIETKFEGQLITVKSKPEVKEQIITVESDWSSASYFYEIVALSDIGSEIQMSYYKENSLQGDSVLSNIYQFFGVETVFNNEGMFLKKISEANKSILELNLNNAPDIAQTIAVTCFALGIECKLFGLHTLKIKETDRLEALQNELTKLGANISVTNDALHLESSSKMNSNVMIETYNDHRMAMAFAPLGMKTNIHIKDANVVTKSYRNYWSDLQQIGFQLKKI